MIAVFGIALSAVTGFLSAKYGLKDFVRDKHEELLKKIHDLEIQLEKLKGRDEVQQTIIESLSKNFQDMITKFNNELNTKKNVK